MALNNIANLLFQALKEKGYFDQKNADRGQAMTMANMRAYQSNKNWKNAANIAAERNRTLTEIAGIREQGQAARAEQRKKQFDAKLQAQSEKDLIANKFKEQNFIRTMGRPQKYEGPTNQGFRTYDNPFASVTGGPLTVKQPIVVRPAKKKTKDLTEEERAAAIESFTR
jgi:hypothetical protein